MAAGLGKAREGPESFLRVSEGSRRWGTREGEARWRGSAPGVLELPPGLGSAPPHLAWARLSLPSSTWARWPAGGRVGQAEHLLPMSDPLSTKPSSCPRTPSPGSPGTCSPHQALPSDPSSQPWLGSQSGLAPTPALCAKGLHALTRLQESGRAGPGDGGESSSPSPEGGYRSRRAPWPTVRQGPR